MSGLEISAATLLCIQAAFVFCVCYAIVSDFTRLRIANWIPATLTALFLVYAVLRLDLSAFKDHLILAGIVFVVGFVSFVAGWIGGGDVKLLTALTLWAGPSHGPDLLIMTTLGGGVMALRAPAAAQQHPGANADADGGTVQAYPQLRGTRRVPVRPGDGGRGARVAAAHVHARSVISFRRAIPRRCPGAHVTRAETSRVDRQHRPAIRCCADRCRRNRECD